MKRITILFLLLIPAFAFSQTFDWVKNMGGAGNSGHAYAVHVDAMGNVYTTGKFSGTTDFDPGPAIFNLTSSAFSDVFISKLDASGNFVWAIGIGGSGLFDYGLDITTDNSGNVFTIGHFENTVDFDPSAGVYNLSSYGQGDCFVLKLDVNGDFVWARQIGGTSGDQGNSISLDSWGSIVICGTYAGVADFDPSPTTFNMTSVTGQYDPFVCKLNTSGYLMWAKSMGGNNQDYGTASMVDAFDNIYITGHFRATADFDPNAGVSNLISFGENDIFLTKLDPLGNLIWVKQIGGAGQEATKAISTDQSGNILIAGEFSGTCDFDPNTGSSLITPTGLTDAFVAKLDTSGNLIWAKNIGNTSSGTNSANDVTSDIFNNVYVTGEYDNTTDFNPNAGVYNLTANGSDDAFILKLNFMGNFMSAKSMGGPNFDRSSGIALDNVGKIHTAGYFQSLVDFDPNSGVFNLTALGSADIFVHKMSPCTASPSTILDTVCTSYTSPSGTYIWTTSGLYSDTIGNSQGCDSIISIDLTISSVDTSVTYTPPTLTANAGTGASYQWIYCDSTLIAGDTNQIFNAISNGIFSVIVTQNGCVDTSACYSVTNVSVIENNFGNALLLYPNPTDGKFLIDLGLNYESVNVFVTDINGKLIQSNSYNDSQLLDLKLEEPTGVYLLIIESKEKKAVIRLVKE